MTQSYKTNVLDLVLSLSTALDLVSPAIADHHKRTVYIALRIAAALPADIESRQDIVIAASLHDVGVLSSKERVEASIADSSHHSAAFGYQLLRNFEPFRQAADLIRFHHVPWEHGRGQQFGDAEVPMGSHILNLANRADACIRPDKPVLAQVDRICNKLVEDRGGVFVPEVVDTFLQLAEKEAFWLDMVSPGQERMLRDYADFADIELDADGLLRFAELLAQVIDFRSRYTATHSSGVGTCAEVLANLLGLGKGRCKQLKIGGFLHDIGKLAVPVELLDKAGPLSDEDRAVIKTHSYHTYRILRPISGLDDIAWWCALHHERLNGTGYPFRLMGDQIPREARIIAVADCFTALAEDRPYRKGMARAQVESVLRQMVADKGLDGEIVATLCRHYAMVDRSRRRAQEAAVERYDEFMCNLRQLDLSWATQAHLTWAEQLREYLDGKRNISRGYLLSHRKCALGHWYYGEGLKYYGHIEAMHELERPHEQLHQAVHDVIQHAEYGRMEEAEASLIEVDLLSVEIVRLLESIEQSSWLPSDGSLEQSCLSPSVSIPDYA